MKILAGYPTPHGAVPVPKMSALWTGQNQLLIEKEKSLQRLIKKLFACGIELFKPGEQLEPLLAKVATAVLYMSYKELKPIAKNANLAGHVVVQLQQAAIDQIWLQTQTCMCTWSTVLQEDFNLQKEQLLIQLDQQQSGASGALGSALLKAIEKVNESHDRINGTQQQLDHHLASMIQHNGELASL